MLTGARSEEPCYEGYIHEVGTLQGILTLNETLDLAGSWGRHLTEVFRGLPQELS